MSTTFASGLTPARFFPSIAHEEALARLDYLVASRRRVGVLVGPRGAGKSLVLELAAQAWRRENHAVALVNALALEAGDLLYRTAGEWENGSALDAPRSLQWQAVVDALSVHRCEARASILLVDNAGQAQYDVLDLIARLAQAGDIVQPRLAVVLATDASRVAQLGDELLSRADLRIELAPLDVAETRDYVQSQLSAGEERSPTLDLDATIKLHELTAGLPRRLNQLANLIMLAAKCDGRETIDAATVDAVYRELSAQPLGRR